MRFANIVLPHLGDAFGLARWLAGNDTDASDIVQRPACARFAACPAMREPMPAAEC